MTIASGVRLGAYEILTFIGSGGMGDVYRAKDTKLNRDVALKILPSEFALDADRLARFKREAQVLAALDQTNIGAIYGFEDSEGVYALVLQLVDGPTLADRIAQGPIPLDEALPIARQIGEALEAAHEKGIIHRDLKPANVKITRDGTVKVLDFGLAKALEPASGISCDLTASPTITSPAMTRTGVILGTAAYMSPEQARGRPVDKRTDIWAFGCILYEMLCGRAAFAGDTLTDTLAAVVGREPDWTALPETTTAAVRTVLARCLEKESKRRIRDIGDAQLALNGAFDTSNDLRPATARATNASPRRWLVVAAAILVLTSCAAVVLLWRGDRPAPRVSRLSMPAPGAAALLTNSRETYRSLTLTPDGSSVVYIGGNATRLLVRTLDSVEPVEIAAGQELTTPFVSPDGKWVGFADGNALKRVALTGGVPMALANIKGNALGATWLPDDTIVFATNDPTIGLQRLAVSGGATSELTRTDHDHGQTDHIWPETLPGGTAVLFTITSQTGGRDGAQIAALDLRNNTQKVLVPGGSHAQYVASGHLVYTAAGALWAVPFDLRKLEVRGAPVRVLPQLVTTVTGSGQFAVTNDGTLVYADSQGATSAEGTLVWVERTGRETPLRTPTRAYLQVRLSPDGSRVALTIADQNQDLWVWDLARETLNRVTADPANDTSPVWTPDGRRLVFGSQRDGGIYNLWWQAADGTGNAERLTTNTTTQLPTDMSPDGRDVVFFQITPMRRFDLLRLALAGRQISPLVQTAFGETNGMISPDGRWLAYQANSSGRSEIYVRPFSNTTGGQWVISTTGGQMPAWSANELFFFDPAGALMRVPFDTKSSAWHAGASSKLLDARYFTGTNATISRTYDVSLDGKRILMIKPSGSDAAPLATALMIVQHWDEELKARVPVR